MAYVVSQLLQQCLHDLLCLSVAAAVPAIPTSSLSLYIHIMTYPPRWGANSMSTLVLVLFIRMCPGTHTSRDAHIQGSTHLYAVPVQDINALPSLSLVNHLVKIVKIAHMIDLCKNEGIYIKNNVQVQCYNYKIWTLNTVRYRVYLVV